MNKPMRDHPVFKAKRKDTGEWIEGFFHIVSKGAWLNPIQNGHYITTFKRLDNGEIILTGCYEVDPETVCEFTGLTDKNGKKIFEGDIVSDEIGGKGVVEYLCGAYTIRYDTPIEGGADGTDVLWDGTLLFAEGSETLTVIGSIFDTPELLST
jgi:uncharacterized phage protein (TIGR01671 family)